MTENQALKNETFARLDRICPPHAILASNTSSCNVTAMAAATTRPGQVLGLHFFNPVPLMKLVEVVRTILTDDAAVAAVTEWARAIGKTPVQAKDSTAFIVNRLLVPYLLDAIRVYENGLASLEDIDQAMKLGLRLPDGAVHLARPRRPGHGDVRGRGDVRGVPRAALCARPRSSSAWSWRATWAGRPAADSTRTRPEIAPGAGGPVDSPRAAVVRV